MIVRAGVRRGGRKRQNHRGMVFGKPKYVSMITGSNDVDRRSYFSSQLYADMLTPLF